MIRTATFASLFALALAAGAAHAQAPRDGSSVVDGNVVGGGVATLSGGGDDRTIIYSSGGAGAGMAFHAQPGRLARPTGSFTGTAVEYLEPAPAAPGREAWMVGGGDDAQVVYVRPR